MDPPNIRALRGKIEIYIIWSFLGMFVQQKPSKMQTKKIDNEQMNHFLLLLVRI